MCTTPSVLRVFYNGVCTCSVNKVSYFYKNGKNAWDIRTFWTYSSSLLCTSVFLALSSCSSSSFLLLLFLFKNGQNARDIRQFCSPLPPESPKTLNLTKTMVFYSKSWPPGPKPLVFSYFLRGLPEGPKRPKRALGRRTETLEQMF